MDSAQDVVDQAEAWGIDFFELCLLDSHCYLCNGNVHLETARGEILCPHENETVLSLVELYIDKLPDWEEVLVSDECVECGDYSMAMYDEKYYCHDCAFELLRQPKVKSAAKR